MIGTVCTSDFLLQISGGVGVTVGAGLEEGDSASFILLTGHP